MLKRHLYRLITPGVLLLVLLFSQCDKITDSREVVPEQDTTAEDTVVIRKVLVEDYTGHTCGNCPRAAEKLNELRGIYKERLVTMGVHVSVFAKPCPSLTCPTDAPAGSYKTDFRTPAGTDYNTQFGNADAGLPNGLVNRKKYSGKIAVAYADWGSAVSVLLTQPPDAGIRIVNIYDTNTRRLQVKTTSHFINALSGTYKLVVLMTEDSVVDWQHDYDKNPTNVEFYTHRHVLRGAVNSSWGDAIGNTPGVKTVKDYNITLNAGWNDKQCYVLAFLYNAGTYEVVQAEEKRVR